jgi:hypothetical protein
MITQDDIRTFKNYPIILILLQDIDDPYKKRRVLKTVSKYDRTLKIIHNEVTNIDFKCYLFELVKVDYKNKLELSKFSTREKERLNGYFMAKWREYIRLNNIKLRIKNFDKEKIDRCIALIKIGERIKSKEEFREGYIK